jgi:hypothetical protein
MTDIDLAIGLARKIETELDKRGGTGIGLREKAACFGHHLSDGVLDTIVWISQQRNHIAHQDGAVLEDREGYVKACRRVLRAIDAIPAFAEPRPPEDRRAPPRRRSRRNQYLGLQLLGVVVVGLFVLARHADFE